MIILPISNISFISSFQSLCLLFILLILQPWLQANFMLKRISITDLFLVLKVILPLFHYYVSCHLHPFPFIKLRTFLSIPGLERIFIMNEC